jgi:diguanylate cyclase (GGDEF)-like protein/PAS domain S-box-containing protein
VDQVRGAGGHRFREAIDRLTGRFALSTQVAELTRLVATLQADEGAARAVLDGAPEALVGIDLDGRVEEWNAAAAAMFGWSRDEVLGEPLAALVVPPAMRAAHEQGLRSLRAGGIGPVLGRTSEIAALRRDGSQFPVSLTLWETRVGHRRRFHALLRDVSARRRLEDELAHRALHDSLTGLANRTLFVDRLDHALARRPSPDRHVAVLYLDLDDFKTVNDSLGHSVGDHLLVEVATRLAAATRAGDTLGRLAGDEFALLAEDVAGVGEAQQIAGRLRDALRAPIPLAGRELSVRASIGIALRDGDNDARGLLRNADIAMYTAKATRATATVFRPEMHQAAVERLELKADLQQALARGELRVHYQPYVELASGVVAGFEALVRWEHPVRGLLLPAAFVTLAEETGAIRAIDRWVLAEACRQAAAWQARHPRVPVTMSVNLAARDLADARLVDDVRGSLEETGLPPSSLVLEVTETALAEDVDVAAHRLDQLRALGVRLAIDDFGTGYSSLAALARFPVDTFKIDKQFVDTIAIDRDAPMARAIVEIGGTARLSAVAEGVESQDQLDRLRVLGCRSAQGYLFARPLPAADAEALLGRRLDSRAAARLGAAGHLALPA